MAFRLYYFSVKQAHQFSVDRVLYAPERLVTIAKEAVKEDSVFSLEDRIGLVYDAVALARAGYLDVSAVLSLLDVFRNEEERALHLCCVVTGLLVLLRHLHRLGVGMYRCQFLYFCLDVVRVSAHFGETQRFPKGMSF